MNHGNQNVFKIFLKLTIPRHFKKLVNNDYHHFIKLKMHSVCSHNYPQGKQEVEVLGPALPLSRCSLWTGQSLLGLSVLLSKSRTQIQGCPLL